MLPLLREREKEEERETHRNKAFLPSGLIPLFKAHEFVNDFVSAKGSR